MIVRRSFTVLLHILCCAVIGVASFRQKWRPKILNLTPLARENSCFIHCVYNVVASPVVCSLTASDKRPSTIRQLASKPSGGKADRPTKVRVRIAPSPTGDLHVGNLRTFIYNYLFALRHNGRVILRVDDTDVTREVPGSLDRIIYDLKWVGLSWSRGPGGTGNPDAYYQSKRQDAYKEVAGLLLQRDKAYRCFCSKEDIQNRREANDGPFPKITYDKACSNLSSDQVEANLAKGMPYTVRFRSPYSSEEDFILLRSDGTATYNFACAVDDHEHDITHVIRAIDHLGNTCKQQMILEAVGTAVPKYAHCSLMRNMDHTKIAKRDGNSTKVSDLREMGFCKLPIVNYLACLGTKYADEPECRSMRELSKLFELQMMNLTPIAFDISKLKWLNRKYISELSYEQFLEHLREYTSVVTELKLDFPLDDFMAIVEQSPAFLKNGVDTMGDYVSMMNSALSYKTPLFVPSGHCGYGGVFLNEESQGFLEVFIEWAQQLIAASDVGESLYTLARDMFHSDEFAAINGRQHLPVVRYALTGVTSGPPLTTLVDIWRMAEQNGLPGLMPLRERILKLREIDLTAVDPICDRLFNKEPEQSEL
ncbi:glutamyl-tRNA synthetase [Babesia ovis]|uniref:glutamate--tRNA ligase n=1 Tax=Babesia ovis TaxID=5869 RepID=A0A9W5TA56_BABOV|nr:glutamyl-tRNA synthetase [Babesia ovis]